MIQWNLSIVDTLGPWEIMKHRANITSLLWDFRGTVHREVNNTNKKLSVVIANQQCPNKGIF